MIGSLYLKSAIASNDAVPKLRVGVMLDSENVEQVVAAIIQNLRDANFIELALRVLTESGPRIPCERGVAGLYHPKTRYGAASIVVQIDPLACRRIVWIAAPGLAYTAVDQHVHETQIPISIRARILDCEVLTTARSGVGGYRIGGGGRAVTACVQVPSCCHPLTCPVLSMA